MAAYERVTLNRGGRNSRFDCIPKSDQKDWGSLNWVHTVLSNTYI